MRTLSFIPVFLSGLSRTRVSTLVVGDFARCLGFADEGTTTWKGRTSLDDLFHVRAVLWVVLFDEQKAFFFRQLVEHAFLCVIEGAACLDARSVPSRVMYLT